MDSICNEILSQNERQHRLLYSIVVAGKSAKFAEKALSWFWNKTDHIPGSTPFERVKNLAIKGVLGDYLRAARVGNYKKTTRAFFEIATSRIDLSSCTPDDLEKIHGIGPKTSRFFILWTRPGERYAALDVHILRWMGEQGYKVPKQTPTGKRYAEIEQWFLAEADARKMTPRELDAKIWSEATGID